LQAYKHGIPYKEAARYAVTDIPALTAILNDPSKSAAWANAVTVLGIVGGDKSVKPLLDFAGRLNGELDVHGLNALMSVPNALGFAAHAGSASALETLHRTCTVAGWRARNLNCHFQKYRGETLCLLMSKISIRGLAISCKPAALEGLTALAAREAVEGSEAASVKENVREAIELHKRISRDGLERSFEYRAP
jgi:hypothetical protein